MAKYNLILSHGGALEFMGENFVTTSGKWTVLEFASKILPSDISDTMVCKETLQLPFSHIENLI